MRPFYDSGETPRRPSCAHGRQELLFSESGRTFLMFATRGRTWVALGDPVGPPTEWPELVWRFIELTDSHGGKAAFYQIPPSSFAALSRRRSRKIKGWRNSQCFPTLLHPRRLRSSRSPLCHQAWRTRRPSIRDDPARNDRLRDRRDRAHLEWLAGVPSRVSATAASFNSEVQPASALETGNLSRVSHVPDDAKAGDNRS